MFKILVTGQLKQFKKLSVPSTERYQAVALLREWAKDDRGGYERFWLLYIPKYAMAFAEIQQKKGYTVVVEADHINRLQGEAADQWKDVHWMLGVKGIDGI